MSLRAYGLKLLQRKESDISRMYFLFTLLIMSFLPGFAQEKVTASEDTLIFAVITDTHIGKNRNKEGLGKIVADINRRPEISFVVNTGDVTDFGTVAEMRDLHEGMTAFNIPWYIVPGNHDTGWSGSAGLTYSKYFEDQKFEADINGYKLIGLSTGPYTRMSKGYIPLHQLEWLDDIAKDKPDSQKVLFFTHMPLEDKNLYNFPEVILRIKKMNTVAAFNGHGHRNEIFDYGDGLKGIMTQTAQERSKKLAYNIFYLTEDHMQIKMIDAVSGKDSIWAEVELPDYGKDLLVEEVQRKEVTGKEPLWSIQDSGNIISKPAIHNDLFLVGNLRGEFKARNIKDGKTKWTFNTGEGILSSPAIENERVVFGSADSTVYCLNVQTGELNWKLKTGGEVLASPVIEDGKVFIGSSDFHYRAIDLATGKLLWKSQKLEGFPPGKPAIANGKLFFGTWENMLYALNTEDGSTAWSWELTGKSHYYSPAMATPFAYENRLYIVAPDEILRTFNTHTGEVLDEVEGHRVRESIGGSKEKGLLVAKTMQDSVLVWDISVEKPILKTSLNARFGFDYSPSDVVFDRNTAFFGTTLGSVYAIDLENDKVSWMSNFGDSMVNTPSVLPNNRLLTTSVDGQVLLFRYKDNLNSE